LRFSSEVLYVFHEVVELAFDSFEGVRVNLVLCGYAIEDGLEGFGFGFETESVVNRCETNLCFVGDVE